MNRLIGPIRLVEYKDDERHVYFFGDKHVIDPICLSMDKSEELKKIEVQDFMVSTLKENKDKVIDLFLETMTIDTEILGGYDYIAKITEQFQKCLSIDKKGCSELYPNLRAHYVDVRREEKFNNLRVLIQIIQSFINAVPSEFNKTDPILQESVKEKYKSEAPELERKFKDLGFRKAIFHIYLKQFMKINNVSEDDILNIFSEPIELLKSIKFYKQIENIENKKVGEFIKRYFETKINSESKSNKKRVIFLKKLLKQPYRMTKDDHEYNGIPYPVLRDMLENILDYTMIFMDSYTIARLFRNYQNPKSGRGKGPDTKYSFVYAGNMHISNYLDFFEEYNEVFKVNAEYKMVESNVEEIDFQCIDLTRFKQPFFSD